MAAVPADPVSVPTRPASTSSAAAAATGAETRTSAAATAPFGTYWRTAIPAAPRVDPRSAAMVRYLAADRQGIIANLYDYGVPIFTATASTAPKPVICTKPWGECDLERQPVPVPAAAAPNSGSDRAMVIVDPAKGRSYEFWQARKADRGWRTSWGEVVDLNGPGTGGATGAGISRLAGVVRASEIAAGVIRHPLVFSTSNACSGAFRAPAIKTDGVSSRSDCIPEGARLQLAPSINVAALPGITRGERAVAKALQTYGAYAIDVGAARAAFSFEKPTTSGNPYPAAGFEWDYWHMPHIPWQQLRVLRSWNGS